MLIHEGEHDDPDALFAEAMSHLLAWQMDIKPMLPPSDISVLDQALSKAEKTTPEIKRRLVKACVTVVLADGQVRVNEFELLRAVCDALDCPMPQIGLLKISSY